MPKDPKTSHSASPDFGVIAFNKSMTEATENSHVNTGSGITNKQAPSGMFSSATGGHSVLSFANASIDSLTSHEGMDGMMALGSSDDLIANMAPERLAFGISNPEGFDLSNELTKANLEAATSFKQMSGFDAKKFGIAKESEGASQ